MTYAYKHVNEMIADPICFEGCWSKVPVKQCTSTNCFHCADEPGFMFIPCLFCKERTSQCHLMSLVGVCRVREDHNTGYPCAYVCMTCFPRLNEMLTTIRLQNMPEIFRVRPLSEVMRKWMLENWNFLQT